mgnify:CR=1 FL=1
MTAVMITMRRDGEDVPFLVRAIPGKGLGCIAVRDIHLGERLISEVPLVMCGPSSLPVDKLVADLSAQDQEAFFSLSQNEVRFGQTKTADGIFATNALPSHHFSHTHDAVFTTISRFNHACDNCACFKWNSTIGQLTVHATRPIRKGAEITLSYGFPTGCVLRHERRQRLRDAFGFHCICSKCELDGEALQRSEARAVEIGDTSSFVNELCVWGSLPTLVCVDVSQVLSKVTVATSNRQLGVARIHSSHADYA